MKTDLPSTPLQWVQFMRDSNECPGRDKLRRMTAKRIAPLALGHAIAMLAMREIALDGYADVTANRLAMHIWHGKPYMGTIDALTRNGWLNRTIHTKAADTWSIAPAQLEDMNRMEVALQRLIEAARVALTKSAKP